MAGKSEAQTLDPRISACATVGAQSVLHLEFRAGLETPVLDLASRAVR